jgi:hypothetical protein
VFSRNATPVRARPLAPPKHGSAPKGPKVAAKRFSASSGSVGPAHGQHRVAQRCGASVGRLCLPRGLAQVDALRHRATAPPRHRATAPQWCWLPCG